MRRECQIAVWGCLLALVSTAWGQTAVDLRTQSKSADWRGAARTFPVRVGTGLITGCVAGEIFLRQDGEPGRALHYCDTNGQWQTVGMPADGAAGQMLCHDGSKPFWCTLSGDAAGPAAGNRVVRLQGRPVSESQPMDGWVLGWDETLQSWTPQAAAHWQAGPGIGIADSTVGVDDSVVPQYMIGGGPATGPCAPGRDSYVDITSGRLYYCGQTDTWKVVGDLTGAAMLNAPNTFGAGQKQSFTPSAATAGINVGAVNGDPSAAADGDLWYDSNSRKLRTRQNGANTDVLGGAASSQVAGLQKPDTKRIALLTYPGSGTTLTGFGDTVTPTGTGTAGTVTDSVPVHVNLLSSSVIDSRSEVSGAVSWRSGRNVHLKTMFQLVETSNIRAFVGLSSGNASNVTSSPMATTYVMGFRYDPALDTNWRCVQDNGTGALATSDSGVVVDSSWKSMEVWQDAANSTVNYYIDGFQVCSLNTNYPGVDGVNQNLRYIVSDRTTAAGARNLRISYVLVESDLVN